VEQRTIALDFIQLGKPAQNVSSNASTKRQALKRRRSLPLSGGPLLPDEKDDDVPIACSTRLERTSTAT
jgi:hypothetical protein